MAKKSDTLNLIIDDISDEGVDFNSIEPVEEDDDTIAIEEPKTQESLNSVNSDDSVRILRKKNLKLQRKFTKHKAKLQEKCLLMQTLDLL